MKGSHSYSLPMKGWLLYEEHWTALMCLLDGGQAWGWTRHTHTHTFIFHKDTVQQVNLFVTAASSHFSLSRLIDCCSRPSPVLVAQAFLPEVVRFQYLWRLASESQPPWHFSISPLSKQAPGLLYFAWISMSSHPRDNIQNQTLLEFILMHRMDSLTSDQISKVHPHTCALQLGLNW